MKVLVTDASFKNALCAIRNLGQRGFAVVATSPQRWAQGSYSRYCRQRVRGPAPDQEERYVDFLATVVAREGIDVILPIGDQTVTALSKQLPRFAGRVGIPLVDWGSMQVAASKARTVELAAQQGVAVPRTYPTVTAVERFPVVVKATAGSGSVRYVHTPAELRAVAGPESLIQEYVGGEARALFALY